MLTTGNGNVFDMDSTQILFGVVAPLVISAGSTYAVIRFSPERRDLKRVRELLEKNATDEERQRLANEFKCDVQIADMNLAGAKVTFTSETPFVLKRVQLSSELGAPFTSIEPKTGCSTIHQIDVSQDDIGRLYLSQGGRNQRIGLLTYTILVDGRTVERDRAVRLSEGVGKNPSGAGMAYYYRME